jgi:hypothetical protein
VVSLAKCTAGKASNPQTWAYDKTTKQLTTGDDGGLCLTAASSPGPSPTPGGGGANIVIGRPLHDGTVSNYSLTTLYLISFVWTCVCGFVVVDATLSDGWGGLPAGASLIWLEASICVI